MGRWDIAQNTGQITGVTINTPFSTTVEVQSSGYYEINLLVNATWGGTTDSLWFTPGATSFTTHLNVLTRHYTQPSLMALSNASVVSAVRILGCAALLRNTTPVSAKGGRALGYCASQTEEVWYTLTPDPDALTNVNSEFTADEEWAKGIYGYVRPRQLGQVVRTYTQMSFLKGTLNGDFADPFGFSIFSLAPVMPGVATGGYNPAVEILNSVNVEFWTDNPTYRVGPPQMSVESYNSFVSGAISLPPPFSCNPGHFSLFLNSIRSVARSIADTLEPGLDWLIDKAVNVAKPALRALRSDRPFSGLVSTFTDL